MLQVYKHSNGHLEDDISLATAEKGSWINIINPDSEDLQLVSMIAEIPTDVLKTPLDTEERSHVELEDNYIFVVINIPVLRGTDSYDALPLGVFITPDFIISQQPEPRLHRKVCITALVRLNVYHIVEELSISGGALVPVKCFLRI